MRLKVRAASANEQLLALVTQGLKLHTKLRSDYEQRKGEQGFNQDDLRHPKLRSGRSRRSAGRLTVPARTSSCTSSTAWGKSAG
jgi:hypothetical protein